MKNGGTKGQKHTKTQYPFTRMYLDPKYLENQKYLESICLVAPIYDDNAVPHS